MLTSGCSLGNYPDRPGTFSEDTLPHRVDEDSGWSLRARRTLCGIACGALRGCNLLALPRVLLNSGS